MFLTARSPWRNLGGQEKVSRGNIITSLCVPAARFNAPALIGSVVARQAMYVPGMSVIDISHSSMVLGKLSSCVLVAQMHCIPVWEPGDEITETSVPT